MAESEDDLRRRLQRLEAVVASLLISDAEVPPSLLRRFFRDDGVDDEFRFLIYELASRGRQSPRLTERMHKAEYNIARLRDEQLEHRDGLARLGEASARLQLDAHSVFSLQSMGVDLSVARITRFLPVRVYVDDDNLEGVERLAKLTTDALESLGLEVADDIPAESGSWYKRWFARSKEALKHEEVQDIARKVKRGAELAGLEKQQAEINKTQSDALASLMAEAKNYRNAAIQAGTALVVVTTDDSGNKSVVGVTMTAAQVIALENNQYLLQSPVTLLRELSLLCQSKRRGDEDVARLQPHLHTEQGDVD